MYIPTGSHVLRVAHPILLLAVHCHFVHAYGNGISSLLLYVVVEAYRYQFGV